MGSDTQNPRHTTMSRRAIMALPLGVAATTAASPSTGTATVNAGGRVLPPYEGLPLSSSRWTPQIVVDNASDGFSTRGFTEISTSGPASEKYGQDYAHTGSSTDTTRTARWTPDLPVAGEYQVSVRWRTESNRPDSAPLRVVSDGGDADDEFTLDQRLPAIAWHFLGTFSFTGRGGEYVEQRSGGPYSIADAVKFIPVVAGARPDLVEDFTDTVRSVVNLERGNGWVLGAAEDGIRCLQHRADGEGIAWFHILDQDGVLGARILVPKDATSGSVGLTYRFNAPLATVTATYDVTDRAWSIIEREGIEHDERVVATAPCAIEQGTWVDVEVTFDGPRTVVRAGGAPILTTEAVTKTGPGRVGIVAADCAAAVTDVRFTSHSLQGSVMTGVEEYTIKPEDDTYREGASVVPDRPGELVMLWQDEQYRSSDDGRTFTQEELSYPYGPAGGKHNVLRLTSGTMLSMIPEYGQEEPSWDSPLRFRALRREGDDRAWTKGGLTWTDYREGPIPGASAVIAMNQKVSQAADGTVFFVISTRKPKGSAVGHGTEVHLSTDEGRTWHRAADDQELSVPDEFSEGKVLPTATGYLLYAPYVDTPGIMVSTSKDGETWSVPESVNVLRSARSSMGLHTDGRGESAEHYLAWVYGDIDEADTLILPRARLSLARSANGSEWEYLGDVDRWVAPVMGGRDMPSTQFVDPMVHVTQDHVLVVSGRSQSENGPTGEGAGTDHGFQQLVVYRFRKDELQVRPWPTEF